MSPWPVSPELLAAESSRGVCWASPSVIVVFLSLQALFPGTCRTISNPAVRFVQYWPVCFREFVVGRVGQQINSMTEQMSFTVQMVRGRVVQLWGEAVFTAALLGFAFLYLFSVIHLEHS